MKMTFGFDPQLVHWAWFHSRLKSHLNPQKNAEIGLENFLLINKLFCFVLYIFSWFLTGNTIECPFIRIIVALRRIPTTCCMGQNSNPSPTEHKLHSQSHGLIKYLDTKAKCRHLTKFTCQGTFRQEFISVYRQEILPVMLLFSTQLCKLCNLLSGSTPSPAPLPCVHRYSEQCTTHLILRGWRSMKI